MSGYSVIREMERLTGQEFHQGTVYPLLYELEKNGFIAGEWNQKGGVRIKNYTITEKGVNLLNLLREIFKMPIKEAMQNLIGEKTQDTEAQ